MLRKILVFLFVFFSLSLAIPVLAETITGSTNPTTTSSVATKIACVEGAVATREAAIGVAVKTHTDAVNAAYLTRSIELAGAYSNTTVKTVQAGVKVAWADFNKSIKSAAITWKTSRNTIWSTFRASVKACKSPAGVSDSVNSSSEVSGQ